MSSSSSAASATNLSTLLQKLDVDAAMDECERLEQDAASRGMRHPYPLEHMICLLLGEEIHEARFLYMRLDAEAKKRCDEVWPIVQLLRSGELIDMATINKILTLGNNNTATTTTTDTTITNNNNHTSNEFVNHQNDSNNSNNNGPACPSSTSDITPVNMSTTVGLQHAVGELVRRLQNRTLDTLSRAYEVMGIKQLKRLLNINENTHLQQVCEAHDWKLLQPQQADINTGVSADGAASCSKDGDDDEEQFIMLSPISKQGIGKHDQASSSAQIQGLTEQLVRLQT